MASSKLWGALCLLATVTTGTWGADPVRIAVTGPYSGPSAPMGQSMLAGVKLAADEINLGGGLFGRPLELVIKDDKGDPETAKQVSTEAVRQDKVVAAVGFINTGVALAAQKIYQDARVPVINNVATGVKVTRQFIAPEHKENYIFRNSAADGIQAAAVVRDAVDRRKFQKLAIFHDSTPYGEFGKDQLIAELARHQIKPVFVGRFAPGTADMSSLLKEARGAGAQALLTYALGPDLAAIANERARLAWPVPMIGSWTLSLPNFLEAAGKNAEGARMPQTFIEEANNSRRTGFISAYHAANKTKRIPSAVSAAQGYDSLYLLVSAMFQAADTDGAKVRAALENLAKPVYGVVTVYDRPFTADDHEAISDNMVFMGEVKNGRIVYAYSDEERRSLVTQKKERR
ncbi:MAG: ABC transporter substrate-binding protein [Azonexus sp.]|jgi:branched-chain amino acid transport system substrate-binding protein|nr:ABC transporter substrate-binding protein [Betaproteobacteria bacterium]MBK8918040.1 ABC transporter substrate-binding protein [Betaproteobacteria bacterium]MBP6036785.1 ABC transporter substrate-binding protein [Azonexus sp.]MBP6907318.1 ABC transporter substrate-binding protein [Azonexus sp.]